MNRAVSRFVASRFGTAMVGMSDEWPLTILVAGFASKLAAILLSLFITLLFGDQVASGFSGRLNAEIGLATIAFMVLIMAPLLESVILWLSVGLLGYRLHLPWQITALLSGLIHVPLHGLSLLSISVLPAFALQALILDYWMGRGRPLAGYWVVVGVHAFSNSIAFLGLVLL